MNDELNRVLEIKPASTKQMSRSVCLVISNVLSALTLMLVVWLSSLKGEAVQAGILIIFCGILPLQGLAGLFLVIALIRMERPWWAYLTSVIPFLIFLLSAICNS